MDGYEIKRWRRHGHDRLYVNRTADGRSVGWHDLVTGRTVVLDEGCREAITVLVTSHGAAGAARETPPPPTVPPVAPGADLAANRPGDALRRHLRTVEPNALKRLLAHRLPAGMTAARPWAVGLRGEVVTGRRLDRLARQGWRVLHSIELPGGIDIDHLVIGPSGVFTINTKHHRGAALWQGDRAITVNRAPTRYVPISESEAAKAAHRLSAHCGFPVTVRPVVAVVGADSIVVSNALPTVLLVDADQLSRTLSDLSPTLPAARVEQIYSIARRPTTWTA
ncbi:nuclease-related domain-containing protein [Kitasatospora sp. NPDC094015]|uniref:nuclease-related domain-containing protein n=1 Tax=Kitasatospora sp. NPDC094015 TaxID=3155205 RepID=UPI00332A7CD2